MRRVELHTYQKAKAGHEKDYGVRHGLVGVGVIPCGGYQKLTAMAQRKSKHIGEEVVDGFPYHETAIEEKGLAAVVVLTYEQTKTYSSETWDFFENGKYAYSIKDIWRAGGGYTSNKYVNEKYGK